MPDGSNTPEEISVNSENTVAQGSNKPVKPFGNTVFDSIKPSDMLRRKKPPSSKMGRAIVERDYEG